VTISHLTPTERYALHTSDAATVVRSLSEPAAFALLFDRHYEAIHRYLHRRAGVDLADELAADVFRIAFERRATWSRATNDARPWLFGIAANLLHRHHRVEKRRLLAIARGEEPQWMAFDEDAIASRLDAGQVTAQLAAGLARLRPPDRDAVTLVALAGLSHGETADALGIAVGTVASRLNRARRILASALAKGTENLHG
jgi:RNA polymerase sigma factor (sigma-70 family)